jgi:hypothetical protein
MDKRKILESKVPYVELFGVDGMGKGRPANDTPAAELLPRLELPLMGDQVVANRIRSQARTRAMTVLKTVFAKEFLSIYEKEVIHLVQVHEEERVQRTVAASVESESMVES